MNRPALKALFPYLLGGIFASYLNSQSDYLTLQSGLIPQYQFYSWLISAILVIAGVVAYKKQLLLWGGILLGLSLFALGFFRYQAAVSSPIPPDLYNQKVRLSGYVTYNPDQPDDEERGTKSPQIHAKPKACVAFCISGKLSPVKKEDSRGDIKAKILVKRSSFSIYSPFAKGGRGDYSRRSDRNLVLSNLRYGDVVEVVGELRQPQCKRNEGGFDYRGYLARRGVFGIIYVRDAASVKKVGEDGGYLWMRWMDNLRRRVEGIFERTMRDAPIYANVLKGIILGQKRALPEDILLSFKNSGIMHILAVSGLHVGMIAFAGFLLFQLLFKLSISLLNAIKLRRGSTPSEDSPPSRTFQFITVEKYVYALTAGLVILYACIVGYRPSVIRASVIIILYFIAKIIDRDTDLLNLLGFAALLLLLFNATSLWDIGFQLSFATTAAIIYFMSKWDILLALLPQSKLFQRANKIFLLPLAVSASAQVASQPLIARQFNLIYPIAILTNIAAVWVVWYIVCVAFITVITGFVWIPLALPFAYANRLAIWILLRITHFFSNLPYAVVEVPTPSLRFFVIYTIGILAIANLGFLRREKRKAIIIALAVISFCIWHSAIQPGGDLLEVTFLDVGLGDSAFVRFPDGKNILIDGGPSTPEYDTGERVIAPFLRHKGIRKIDAVILTHPHNDHAGGLAFILKNFQVNQIIGIHNRDIPIKIHRELRAIASEKQIDYQPGNLGSLSISAGHKISQSRFYEVEILNPIDTNFTDFSQSSINNNSIVLKLRFGQITFLFASDIEAQAEYAMLHSGVDLRADILKAPHHGSITSSSEAFLNAVNPAFAVISASELSRFNFPSKAVLRRYKRRGIKLLQTSKSGAITIVTDGRNMWIKTIIPSGPTF
ncbi:TPA: DNA internalization-related competence protein ComEC/Rec2 [Candidatus Poribacteria bacterium]|nr:DNA internalization-related competence protein ComEC/Rec2 [Candidatus Poribacteria bacterium]